MASLIDKERREHYEALQVQKRRADKINQACFILICGIIFEAAFTLILNILAAANGGSKAELIFSIALILSVIFAFIGCFKRNLIMNIIAVVIYLTGFLVTKQYEGVFVLMGLCLHLIPYGGAVYANFIEHQLRQEEGYPQFDLSLEEKSLRDNLEMQTQEAALAEKRPQSSEMDII